MEKDPDNLNGALRIGGSFYSINYYSTGPGSVDLAKKKTQK